MSGELPLDGTLVLDLTRMLPGAVLTRSLVDLGARVIKIEDPGSGDPMRSAPPLVEGVGAGFRAFMRSTESVCLDLRTAQGAGALRKLAKHADVLVESFRPGTMEKWGLGRDRLAALNAGLITCSLSGFGSASDFGPRVAHDLNIAALSGLLSRLPSGMPGIQVVDVTTGLLATSAILAALLTRHRTHRGQHIEQAMALAPLPYLTWAWADASALAGGAKANEPALLGTLLAGEGASYRLYRCADGLHLAVGAIEPKFWAETADLLGLPGFAGDGLLVGDAAQGILAQVAARFAAEPRAHWLELADARNLPVTPVNDVATGMADPVYQARHSTTPLPSGGALATPVAYVQCGATSRAATPAPALGQHTRTVLAEFGCEP